MQSEFLALQDFLSGIQDVENVIINHLSESFNHQQIAINPSPHLCQPLLSSYDSLDSTMCSIKTLLELFIERWRQEIHYYEEILRLKDKIIDEFNTLCTNLQDEKIIDLIREQTQKVVDFLFIQTDIDKKQTAGYFCKKIMNGFHAEMLDKFTEYTSYVLFTSYSTPLPQGLIEFTKQVFKKEICESPNEENVVSASKKNSRVYQQLYEKSRNCNQSLQ